MNSGEAPTPDMPIKNPKENIQNQPFNENEQIILNDPIDSSSNVINKPVIVTTTEEINNHINNNGDEILNDTIFNRVISYIKYPFLKLGKYVQNLISKLSEKVQINSSYKYFLIFLALGAFFFFFSALCLPFVLFNPGKFLRFLSFGNIFIMLSFLFYYGSKDFFSFLIDEKRTCIVFAHLLSSFFGLFISLFIGGYFIQFLLDFILGMTTIMFILTLLPGGKGGISAIKNILMGPGFFIWNKIKSKIFGDNYVDSVLPQ